MASELDFSYLPGSKHGQSRCTTASTHPVKHGMYYGEKSKVNEILFEDKENQDQMHFHTNLVTPAIPTKMPRLLFS